ncbi:hypothetical protein ACFYMB_14835 [Micromonospora haikouensis]|uniref:hypothetical protein n=1 Tax=Micromonospora haikouensis TaxID=686309 RepID=UPI0036884853
MDWRAAFFGCLYYAGMHPSEAADLRREDCDVSGRCADCGTDFDDMAAVKPSWSCKHDKIEYRWGRLVLVGTSPLVRRPYALRYAAASLWLNAGVLPTEVARCLGHGVAVLLRVYANCIDGGDDTMNDKIGDALG